MSHEPYLPVEGVVPGQVVDQRLDALVVTGHQRLPDALLEGGGVEPAEVSGHCQRVVLVRDIVEMAQDGEDDEENPQLTGVYVIIVSIDGFDEDLKFYVYLDKDGPAVEILWPVDGTTVIGY